MLTGAGEKQDVNPLLGALANNGGQTNTRALAVNSPAIDAGSGCAALDQRGVTRPGGSACDIGAFEFIPPTLRVTTTVVNDNGGTKAASDFVVHVKQGATEAPKQPAERQRERHDLHAHAGQLHRVGRRRLPGYTGAISGDCDGKGDVALAENQAKACTITLNDVAPTLTVITNVTNDNGGTKVRGRLQGPRAVGRHGRRPTVRRTAARPGRCTRSTRAATRCRATRCRATRCRSRPAARRSRSRSGLRGRARSRRTTLRRR